MAVSEPQNGTPGMERLRLALGWTIVGAWTLSLVLDAIPGSTYDPPASVHVLMMVVAGALFGPRITGRGR